MTISSELAISDQRAEEIMNLAKVKLREKDYAHEILKDFVCSDFDTSELVFACYVLGAMIGQLRSDETMSELQKMMYLMKKLKV